MHPIPTSERPSPAIAAPASSPAPADAGQGVGTLSAFGLKHLNALRVLTAMQKEKFRQGDFDSAECEALEMALYALNLRIEERGYRA